MPLDLHTIEWIKKLEQENKRLEDENLQLIKRVALLESIMYDDTMQEYESLEQWKDSYNKGYIDE